MGRFPYVANIKSVELISENVSPEAAVAPPMETAVPSPTLEWPSTPLEAPPLVSIPRFNEMSPPEDEWRFSAPISDKKKKKKKY